MTQPNDQTASVAVDVANVVPPKKISRWILWLFISVIAASLLSLGLWRWHERGLVVSIFADEAYDLRPGCKVKCGGAEVGKVLSVSLTDNFSTEVRVALHASDAVLAKLACASSKYWIVHPRVSPQAVEGLDAIFTRYLGVLPGEGSPKRRFIALSSPPILEDEEGGIKVELRAADTEGIAPGAPVTFRDLPIGKVLSVRHLSNGNGVEFVAWVSREYAPLVCEKTEWWKTGGAKFSMELTGVSAEIGSLQSLFVGGMALATPPGREAGTCYASVPGSKPKRYDLHAAADDDWLEWQPHITIGSALLRILDGEDGAQPRTYPASLQWKAGKKDGSQQGFVLFTDQGFLGPKDVLVPPADTSEVVLKVNGVVIPWKQEEVSWQNDSLALYRGKIDASPWTKGLLTPKNIVDIAVFTTSAVPTLVDRDHLKEKDGTWTVDAGLPFNRTSWHGAVVVSREDGSVIGILCVDKKDRATVVPWFPPQAGKP